MNLKFCTTFYLCNEFQVGVVFIAMDRKTEEKQQPFLNKGSTPLKDYEN